jgi:hypothetical protein
MTTALSFVFGDDLQRDEIERFKAIPNCIGVSSFKNTLNVYFRSLDRKSLLYLAFLLQEEMVQHGEIMLNNSTLSESNTAQDIYSALRSEVAI